MTDLIKQVAVLAEAKEAPQFNADEIAKALAGAINHNGTRIFDVEMYDEDVLHFAIEFDFSEGLIKGAEVKKVSQAISKVAVEKSPDWRHGDTGASYLVTLKVAPSEADGQKLVRALKKHVKAGKAKAVTEDYEDDVKVGARVENISPMRAGKAYANFGSPAKVGDVGKVTKVHDLRDVEIVQFKKDDGSVVYTHRQNVRMAKANK